MGIQRMHMPQNSPGVLQVSPRPVVWENDREDLERGTYGARQQLSSQPARQVERREGHVPHVQRVNSEGPTQQHVCVHDCMCVCVCVCVSVMTCCSSPGHDALHAQTEMVWRVPRVGLTMFAQCFCF